MLNPSEAPARLIAQRFAPYSISDSSAKPQTLSLNARIAALPWRATKRGEKVMLSLSEAAISAGIAKSTIWRAVKAGRLSASRTVTGTYQVDPAELFRVFPAMPKNVEMRQPAPVIETAVIPALEAQLSALKEVSSLLREQLEDARKDRDPAEVMHLPCTGWPGRGGIGRPPVLHVRTLAPTVTNVIGDEQSRANQPDAHSCDERWHGAGSNAPPIGAPETRSGT